MAPSTGSILFEGRDISRVPAHRQVGLGIARTFQITEIFPELTVFENIRIVTEVAAGYRLRPWLNRAEAADIRRRIEQTLALAALSDKADRLVGELAHGDQRATEIMMALALKPRLLLLDEPTAGMGDQETYDITQLIRRLHKDNKLTIVLIEHDMRVVFHLADQDHRARSGRLPRRRHAAGDRREPGGADRLSGPGRMSAALTAEGLHTYYGKSHILHGVSLKAGEGQVTALLAGRTARARPRRCAA